MHHRPSLQTRPCRAIVPITIALVFLPAATPSNIQAQSPISAVLFTAGSNLVGTPIDTVTLAPAKDNTLYEDPDGGLSNGNGTAMFAGRNSASVNSVRRALLAFDVAAAIPAGSTIERVTLTLFNDAANIAPATLSLHRIIQSWGEAGSLAGGGQGGGAPATPGDATWLHNFYDTNYWSTPGGDFLPVVSSSLVVSDAGFYTWPSTATVIADVQSFLDDPSGNFGWLLAGDESTSSTAKRFTTREAQDPSVRPLLTIEFTPVPEPSSGCLLLVLIFVVRGCGRNSSFLWRNPP